MRGDRLVRIMKETAANGIPKTSRADLVWGTVESTSPMTIVLDNDPNIRLTEKFLVLSPFCKEWKWDVPSWQTETASGPPGTPHLHTISTHSQVQMWRGLQAGDKVIMLRASGGNLYYVLQREGDL